ncbi:hypothetical protein CUMW_070240 [Citrus unshiu]|nr:hypothetical protein CUMW_070240 [Citrus unshiu]
MQWRQFYPRYSLSEKFISQLLQLHTSHEEALHSFLSPDKEFHQVKAPERSPSSIQHDIGNVHVMNTCLRNCYHDQISESHMESLCNQMRAIMTAG